MRQFIFLTVFLLIASTGQNLFAADLKGSSDHPMVSRYDGSIIKSYDYREFNDYKLLLSKAIYDPYPKVGAKNIEKLEGKITRITYLNPEKRTTLEIIRNYENELKGAGFDILFSCSTGDCGGRAMNNKMTPEFMYTTMGENYSDQRYFAAKLSRAEGDVYIALYSTLNKGSGGPTKDRVFTQLDVIEIAPMQTGMVTVDADAMAKEIFQTGSISIYGILFDFDKADIKPESAATIGEIAKLLKNNPDLKLFIVGHTDNKGSLDYNTTLSKNRATSVVNELVSKHGISSSRLIPEGLAFLAPVASNKTEDGRAKNRRVELVEH